MPQTFVANILGEIFPASWSTVSVWTIFKICGEINKAGFDYITKRDYTNSNPTYLLKQVFYSFFH